VGPGSAGYRLTCRLDVQAVAGCGLMRPRICGRWLPVWLPGISLATLIFGCSNSAQPPPRGSDPAGQALLGLASRSTRGRPGSCRDRPASGCCRLPELQGSRPSPQGAAARLRRPVRDQGALRVRSRPVGAAAARRRQGRNWQRWYRENVPIAERRYLEYTAEKQEQPAMPERTPLHWEDLHAAGVSPRRSRPVRASCSPRRAGTSSPRPASS
jgi:hypothetical protein